jgi:hypothetical protein
MPNYSVIDTVKKTTDTYAFVSDEKAISGMNAGRSLEMPNIIIKNLNTGTVIYTGYAVKPEDIKSLGNNTTIMIVVAIVIIIAIAYFAMRK